ncbi:MAG TPA: hypothetical protein ENI08_02580 [Candidatus Dependentiae bacterium]|nr:hypothetical protein [Candidatus Dependentiae bacterium]
MFRKLLLLSFIAMTAPTYTIDPAVVKELEEKTDAIVDNLGELIKIFFSHPEIGSFIKKANALVDGVKEISEIDNYEEREKAKVLGMKKMLMLPGKLDREREKGDFQNLYNTDEDERRKFVENLNSFAVFAQEHFGSSLFQSTKDN